MPWDVHLYVDIASVNSHRVVVVVVVYTEKGVGWLINVVCVWDTV